jgi:hypothetical protein
LESKTADKPKSAEPAGKSEPGPGFSKLPAYQRGRGKRVALRIDAEGNINWEGIDKDSKGFLQSALKNPATFKNLGLAPPSESGLASVPAPQFKLEPKAMAAALRTFAAFEGVLLGKTLYGAPPLLAVEVFSLTDGEVEMLEPIANKVVAKWAPELLAKYNEEVNLLLLWVMVTQAKTKLLKVRMAMERKKAKEAAAQAATPPPEPEAQANGAVQ